MVIDLYVNFQSYVIGDTSLCTILHTAAIETVHKRGHRSIFTVSSILQPKVFTLDSVACEIS